MIIDCPRCGVKRVQTTVVNLQTVTPNPASNRWNVVRCQNPTCSTLVLVETDQSGRVIRIYPARSYELDSLLPVPLEIRGEFREAGLCLDAGCYRASLVMSRRALQRCLKLQGCDQRNLGGKDGALAHAIASGILRKAFHEVAEEIKEYGNLSAHPDDDQLENANEESARHVLGFLELIIDEFYRLPAAAAALKKARARGPA